MREDLREDDFFRLEDLRLEDLRCDLLEDFLRLDDFFFDFLEGTLSPSFRASDSPIAIACLRLFTFLPERPLFNFPCLYSSITFFTFFCVFFPYLAMTAPPAWVATRL